MDTMKKFALGLATMGKERKVFDWDKAATIIKESGAKEACAGLSGDLEWTGGPIFSNGKIVAKGDTYTYLASTWAIPVLVMEGEEFSCYKMESETDWDEDTYWPDSAREMLERF